jgi:oligoribonuclease (3'-5' exoribonuclease)
MKPTHFVSLDIETTGLDPETCQILEFGAVIDSLDRPRDERKEFQCFVVHDRIVGEPYALAMNHEILRILAEKEKYPQYRFLRWTDVSYEFSRWLKQNTPESKSHTAGGKNFAGFDLRFLRRLPGWKENVRLRHRYIDPAELWWNPEIDGTLLPDSDTCLARAEIAKSTAHRALADAHDTCELVRRWSERQRAASAA